MAIERHNTIDLTPQTAADVWAAAVAARRFRPAAYARPAAVSPAPEPATPAPVLSVSDLPVIPGRIPVRRVLELTAEHFGLELTDLTSECRVRRLVRARQMAMYVASKVTGRSLAFIGRHLGGRDHTTILHGRDVVAALVDARDAETVEAVNAIVGKLGEVRQ